MLGRIPKKGLELFENVDLKNKNDLKVKQLNKILENTCYQKDADSGYELTDAKLINNAKLEERYNDYKKSLNKQNDRGRVTTSFGFYAIESNNNKNEDLINDIANEGFKCRKVKTNHLGNSEMGVYVARNLDLMLKYFNSSNTNKILKCFLVNAVFSKPNFVDPNLQEESNQENLFIDPDFNSDCHLLSEMYLDLDKRPQQQYFDSLIYLYEYDKLTTEVQQRPRCVQPYALLTFTKVKKLKTKNIFRYNKFNQLRPMQSMSIKHQPVSTSDMSSSSSFEKMCIKEPKSTFKTDENDPSKPKKSIQVNLKLNERVAIEPRVSNTDHRGLANLPRVTPTPTIMKAPTPTPSYLPLSTSQETFRFSNTLKDPRLAKNQTVPVQNQPQKPTVESIAIAEPPPSAFNQTRVKVKNEPEHHQVEEEEEYTTANEEEDNDDEEEDDDDDEESEGEQIDLFDTDAVFRRMLSAKEIVERLQNKYKHLFEKDENVPKWRLYYERTGIRNIKFRGESKLKVALVDIKDSTLKFLDPEKTRLNVNYSTNKLKIEYDEKRRRKTTGIPTVSAGVKLRDVKKAEVEEVKKEIVIDENPPQPVFVYNPVPSGSFFSTGIFADDDEFESQIEWLPVEPVVEKRKYDGISGQSNKRFREDTSRSRSSRDGDRRWQREQDDRRNRERRGREKEEQRKYQERREQRERENSYRYRNYEEQKRGREERWGQAEHVNNNNEIERERNIQQALQRQEGRDTNTAPVPIEQVNHTRVQENEMIKRERNIQQALQRQEGKDRNTAHVPIEQVNNSPRVQENEMIERERNIQQAFQIPQFRQDRNSAPVPECIIFPQEVIANELTEAAIIESNRIKLQLAIQFAKERALIKLNEKK